MKYINNTFAIKFSMIKKYYWAMAVMAAFVAGTIATATPVYAPPNEDDDKGLVDAVNRIADILDNLEQIAGPQGEQGEQGEPGPIPTLSVVERSDTVLVGSNSFNGIAVPCMEDEILISGGFSTTPAALIGNMDVFVNHENPDGWVTRIANTQTFDIELTVFAYCAKLTP